MTALRVEGDENGADGADGVVRMLVRASGKSHREPFETRLDGKTKKNVVVTMMGLSRRSRGQRPFAHQMVELSRLDRWVLLVVPDSAQPREERLVARRVTFILAWAHPGVTVTEHSRPRKTGLQTLIQLLDVVWRPRIAPGSWLEELSRLGCLATTDTARLAVLIVPPFLKEPDQIQRLRHQQRTVTSLHP
ncbi:hypothetical protein VTN00DRAFT_10260 [Thermoascus crustaceus]|uniref:uncharacterized protein n=1 Tax=Thermoascus crustaceus TaxID=5088 RepID=UPI003743C98B